MVSFKVLQLCLHISGSRREVTGSLRESLSHDAKNFPFYPSFNIRISSKIVILSGYGADGCFIIAVNMSST